MKKAPEYLEKKTQKMIKKQTYKMFLKKSKSNLKCTQPVLAHKKRHFNKFKAILNILSIYKQASSKSSACSNRKS